MRTQNDGQTVKEYYCNRKNDLNSHVTEDLSYIPVQRRRFLYSKDTLSGRHPLLRAC
jgi:hypothetical protein